MDAGEPGTTRNPNKGVRMKLGKVAAFAMAWQVAGCAMDNAPDVSTESASDGLVAAPHAQVAPQTGALRTALQNGLDKLHADGVVGDVGRVSDGCDRIDGHGGVARLGGKQPVALQSQFRMGSNTKTFVAVVMLQLVDEGRVRLDDPIDRWLPGVVSGNGNDGTKITIRNLLQHTSGLYNYTGDLFAVFGIEDYYATRFQHYEPEQLVAIAVSHAPNFAPGTAWSYSNTNYILAGMIIKKVTHHDWSSEVRARILAPLHLDHTFEPGDSPDLPAPHAEGYSELEAGKPLVDVTLANVSVAGAAGSLITTTDDLTRFWRALQAGKLLSPARMAEMHTTVPATELEGVIPGARDGLGIFWTPTRCGGYWNHLGDTLGFSTRSGVNEEGSRAVVVSQSTTIDNGSGFAVAKQLLDDDLETIENVMCAGE
jgi:D-alanyl-D-alanine carboxypeptidase